MARAAGASPSSAAGVAPGPGRPRDVVMTTTTTERRQALSTCTSTWSHISPGQPSEAPIDETSCRSRSAEPGAGSVRRTRLLNCAVRIGRLSTVANKQCGRTRATCACDDR
ncbi:hypothetical protein BS78_05G056300 [Paspalum vaginatum]|nr:hypothetical protein BS78_05G056300 [Paspalum vaginatum]